MEGAVKGWHGAGLRLRQGTCQVPGLCPTPHVTGSGNSVRCWGSEKRGKRSPQKLLAPPQGSGLA